MADKLEGHDFATGASIPYPEDNGALWDRVRIGPHILPGTWTIRGSAKRRVDVKTTKGSDGARFRDQGYKPGQFTLSGELIGASDWNEMVKIAKILTPRNRGVAVEPLAVEHPTFTYLGITNVLVLEVFAPVLDGGKVRSTIMVTEWLPRPKTKKKAKDVPIAGFLTLQLQARAALSGISPADAYDTDNAAQDISKLPGLRPTERLFDP